MEEQGLINKNISNEIFLTISFFFLTELQYIVFPKRQQNEKKITSGLTQIWLQIFFFKNLLTW